MAAGLLAARRWLSGHKISYDGVVRREGHFSHETTD
jgi:hypothetical protein